LRKADYTERALRAWTERRGIHLDCQTICPPLLHPSRTGACFERCRRDEKVEVQLFQITQRCLYAERCHVPACKRLPRGNPLVNRCARRAQRHSLVLELRVKRVLLGETPAFESPVPRSQLLAAILVETSYAGQTFLLSDCALSSRAGPSLVSAILQVGGSVSGECALPTTTALA